MMPPGAGMPPPQGMGGDQRPPSGFAMGPNEPMMQQPGAPPLPPSGFRMGPNEPMMQQASAEAPGTPMPRPRPPGASPTDLSSSTPPGAPMNLTPDPAAAVQSARSGEIDVAPVGGSKSDPWAGVGAAIGAGLTAAGNSSGKSPFQAASSGAGAAMTAQKKSDDDDYTKRIKALDAAITAQQRTDDAGYKTNYLKYLNADLKRSTEAAASKDAGRGGKAWNKPPEQLYLDGKARIDADNRVKAAAKALDNAQRNGSTAQQAAAKMAFDQIYGQVSDETFKALKIDPNAMANLGKGAKTPHPSYTSKEEFERYVKPGEFFTNPKDGKVYQRKMPAAGDSGASSAAPPASSGAPSPVTGDDDEDET
jgi:hypothetical protein